MSTLRVLLMTIANEKNARKQSRDVPEFNLTLRL
jgi:hypothetical protein